VNWLWIVISGIVLNLVADDLFQLCPCFTRKIMWLAARIDADDPKETDDIYNEFMEGLDQRRSRLVSFGIACGLLLKVAVARRARNVTIATWCWFRVRAHLVLAAVRRSRPASATPCPTAGRSPTPRVFISYRSNDEPAAAAMLYTWLGAQFGKECVFRDYDSMQAGEHYPTAIRDALEHASILVAVIGPRWLTLTESCSGLRLIDRPDDWVRMEITTALRRQIPVVPVLLKDTPAGTTPPMPADLPADMRPLATVQAFNLRQRRLGEDSALLTERLAALAPA